MTTNRERAEKFENKYDLMYCIRMEGMSEDDWDETMFNELVSMLNEAEKRGMRRAARIVSRWPIKYTEVHGMEPTVSIKDIGPEIAHAIEKEIKK